ncbi:MAG: hypothetical protein RBR77_12200 [Thauera sp.]|nr:hypothetical protein [Thauera sp.]
MIDESEFVARISAAHPGIKPGRDGKLPKKTVLFPMFSENVRTCADERFSPDALRLSGLQLLNPPAALLTTAVFLLTTVSDLDHGRLPTVTRMIHPLPHCFRNRHGQPTRSQQRF